MARRLLIGIMLVALTGPAAAFAANPKPASAAEARSKSGKELFNQGRYDDAIAEYQAAYQLVPAPKYLFNIARAYHRKGSKEEALDHYRRYLTDDPSGPGAGEAREYVVELEKDLAAEKLARSTPPPAASPSGSEAPPPPPPATVAAATAPPTRGPAIRAFGPKLGSHISTIDDPIIGSSHKLGVVAGGFIAFAATAWLDLGLDLLYAQKGSYPDDNNPLSLHYIELPVLLRPHHLGWFAEVGPYVGYLVSSTTAFDSATRKIDLGGIVGAGYSWSFAGRALIFEARYEMGFTSIKVDDVPVTRTIALSVGYSFR